MLALRRDDPDSAGTGTPNVSFFVDLDSVRAAEPLTACRIEQEFAIGHRTIGLNGVAQPLILLRIAYVEDFLIGGKPDSVGSGEILNHKLQMSVVWRRAGLLLLCAVDAINAVHRQPPFRVLVALSRKPVGRIGEVERSV